MKEERLKDEEDNGGNKESYRMRDRNKKNEMRMKRRMERMNEMMIRMLFVNVIFPSNFLSLSFSSIGE